jgi:hypothetical protein
MTDRAADVKRRFDDVYRTLPVIGPVLSFALSSYAASSILKELVFDFGYPALMTSILIWGSPTSWANGESTMSGSSTMC